MPGIIGERLFSKFNIGMDSINETSFIKNITLLYASDIDSKLKFTFDMYDFNSDGIISREDVRIILQYTITEDGLS